MCFTNLYGKAVAVEKTNHGNEHNACVCLIKDVHVYNTNMVTADELGPLLLTWFNFNPSVDK